MTKFSWKDTVANVFKDTLACVWKDWIYYIFRILVSKLPSKYSASLLFDQHEAKSLSDSYSSLVLKYQYEGEELSNQYYVKFHGEI